MTPVLVNGPAREPVDLDDMRLYLRLDGESEDAVLAAMIAAARQTVEAASGRMLIDQRWRLRLDRWPVDGVIWPPFGPLRTLDAARLVAADGTSIAMETGGFIVDAMAWPGRIIAPATRPALTPGGRIEIDVTLGHGAQPDDVPPPLTLAVRAMVAHWFENRGDDSANSGAMLPDAVRTLLTPYRRLGLR